MMMNIIGALLFFFGLAISFTIVGAVFGLPMMALGFPMLIIGAVLTYKARADKTREAISRGIQEGLTRSQAGIAIVPRSPATDGGSHAAIALPSPTSTPVQRRTGEESPGAVGASPTAAVPRDQANVAAGGNESTRQHATGATASPDPNQNTAISQAATNAFGFVSDRRVRTLVLALGAMTIIALFLAIALYRQPTAKTMEPGVAAAPAPPAASYAAVEYRRVIAESPTPVPTPLPTQAVTAVSGGIPSNPFRTRPQPTPDESDANEGLDVPVQTAWPGEQFPQTRSRTLAVAEVQSWPLDNLQYAINEMYARRGADFGDERVSKTFARFSWYQPQSGQTPDIIEAAMSPLERENLKVLGTIRDAKRGSTGSQSGQRPRPDGAQTKLPPDPFGQWIGRMIDRNRAKSASPSPKKKRQ